MQAIVDNTGDRKEILVSKKAMPLYFLASMIFVALGVWFVVAPPTISGSFILWHPAMIAAVGWSSILFFGFGAVVFLGRIFSTKPGFVVTKTGLTVNFGGAAIGIGEILWSDVTKITVYEDPQGLRMRFKWICLMVQNPDDYIGKQNHEKRRRVMVRSLEVCGTPIAISGTGLAISCDELLKIVNEYYAMSRQDVLL
jgi:hypothetical protein